MRGKVHMRFAKTRLTSERSLKCAVSMPATWSTKEQKAWLRDRIPQYLEAQRMSRVLRVIKTIHKEWMATWPERNIVCPPKVGEPDLPLTPEQEEKVAAITKVRAAVSILLVGMMKLVYSRRFQ